jgi:predicted DNA-binding transcriptional regulator AlpA
MSTDSVKKTETVPPQPLLIDIKEVARMLDRSEMSIRRDDDEGRIPRSIMIGGSKRWRLKELRLWVKAGCPDRATWESGRSGLIRPVSCYRGRAGPSMTAPHLPCVRSGVATLATPRPTNCRWFTPGTHQAISELTSQFNEASG